MKNNQKGPAPRSFSEVGFSLFEMLVVIFIFGFLGMITTQIILLSLRSAGKSESIVKVREDVNYAVAVMEREIRNAKSVDICDSNTISYTNPLNKISSFSCSSNYIASASARITGDDISITNCIFSCTTNESGNVSSVSIQLGATNINKSGAEAATMDFSTQINLRNQ